MNLKNYLPSLPFTLFVGAFVLSAALIYGAMYLGRGTGPSILSIEDARPTDPAVASLDTDHDSLPDWEEAVRGTDPKNADTDGDGTLDGEEARIGRDPNKPFPNDSLLSKENEAFIADLLSVASSTNITDDISQRLFAQYASALNKTGSADEQTQEAIVADALARSKIPLHGKTYTPSDLTIVPDTRENVRAFANQSILAIIGHPNASLTNTVVVFGAAMDTGDKRSTAAFPILGKEYQELAKELLVIPVPNSYSAEYLQIINSYEKGGAAFEDMRFHEKDPVRALSGFANYVQMMRISIDMLTALAQKITGSGILFNATEAGRVWQTFLAPSA